MLLIEQRLIAPVPTPILMPLQVDCNTQFETTTSSQAAFLFFRRDAPARSVRASSSVSLMQSLTTTLLQESMSMPSLLCPRGSFFISRRVMKTFLQPWKNDVQNGAFKSLTSRTETFSASQKISICAGRHLGYLNFEGYFSSLFPST